jgi:hypothetical protein
MPIYLDIYNLIVAKKAVTESYSGGIPQFRIDYNIPLSEINQEDDELFSFLRFNVSLSNNYFQASVSQGGRCVVAMTEVPIAKGLFFFHR